MNKKITLLIAGFVVLVVIAGLAQVHVSKAQLTPLHLYGFAWSAYTDAGATGGPGGLGWLSFDGKDETPVNTKYAVLIDQTTGELSGSAWSPNYGWLSFDRSITGNPPSDDISSGSGPLAKKVGSTIVGWARFVAGCQGDLWNGTACTGTGAGSANGVSVSGATTISNGWDGWVSLNKKASETAGISYGLTVDATNAVKGYAWGGSTNVGWLLFDQQATGGNPCTGLGCIPVVVTNGSFSATCSAALISSSMDLALNSPVQVTWTASASGSTGPFSYAWTGDAPLAGRTGGSYTAAYTTTGIKTGYVSASNANHTATTSSTQCGGTTIAVYDSRIAVTPTNPVPGSCTAPANANQCSGSDTSVGPLNLLENGGCAGLAAPVTSCSFECAPTYIKRGTGATAQCVKKSTVIEQ